MVGLFMVCIAGVLEATKDMSPYGDGREQLYQNLVVRQIASEWECVSPDRKEAFVFSLMDRFSPDDRKIITSGKIWKNELEQKARDGSLTVGDREKLNSGYYYDPNIMSDIKMRIEISFGNFSPPSCLEEYTKGGWQKQEIYKRSPQMCNPPYMSISDASTKLKNFEIIYEDRYSRWQLSAQKNLKKVISEEYGRLRDKWAINNEIRKLEKYLDYQEQVKQRAEQAVLDMNATDVSDENKAQVIKAKYLQLWCSGKNL